jgi:mannose-1-phosphate guanylyltransferase/mannose-6-phosphate isomerase
MRVVILCGGSGSRLWPESRESLPKQFIPIFDNNSLLDMTIERFLDYNLKEKPIFICNKKHGFLVKNSIEKFNIEAEIILEPSGKNTCAAIYLAAKFSKTRENLLIIPSDHLIPNKNKFMSDVLSLESKIFGNNWITLGIKPTTPSEAYGYIKVKKNNKNDNLHKVIKFTEKPPKQIAQKFINNDNYYWNAGIFISNTATIINSVRNHAPDIAQFCDKAFQSSKINKKTNEINFEINSFSNIPSQSIDYAVMEHEKNIFLFPFEDKWSDVGSWDALSIIYKYKSENKNIVEIDSKNNFIRSEKRTIATIGVNDLIIVDSDNATLISKRNHTEKVKDVVNSLAERNSSDVREHSYEIRPWGKFENLIDDQFCKVKRITIYPQKRLSLQYHNFRSEHWLVVNGTAEVFLDNKILTLLAGESIDIPVKSKHYINNKTNKNLIIIETQLGSYFGEDDIVRIDDPYER